MANPILLGIVAPLAFQNPVEQLMRRRARKNPPVAGRFESSENISSIIHSAATQDPDAGLVDLDYDTARFLIQYDGIEQIVIRKE